MCVCVCVCVCVEEAAPSTTAVCLITSHLTNYISKRNNITEHRWRSKEELISTVFVKWTPSY